jgi:hypothetical protein
MNAAIVSHMLSLIPDRVARMQSGSIFNPQAPGACAHPQRVAHLAQFLDWLGPLREVTKDDLLIFGVVTASGRAASEAALDVEPDDEAEPAVLEPAPALAPAEEPREPALT